MEDNNIQKWLQQARQAGLSDRQIKERLNKNGWEDEQINQLLNTDNQTIAKSMTSEQIAQQIAPTKKRISFHKPSKKTILITTGAIILALIIGGGIFAYMKGYLPIPFLSKNAEELLMKSFNKLANSKGGEIGFTFQIVGEERQSGLKPIEIKSAVGESPARQQAKNSTAMSDISQLKTALVLYADDNDNTYPAKIDEVATDYIRKIPKHPDGDAYNYSVSEDKKSYTLSFKCLGGDEEEAKIDSNGNTTSCSSISSGFELSALSYVDEIVNYIPSDLNITGEITAFTDYKKVDLKDRKGIFTINGSLNTGGTTFNVDAEARMKDGKAYIQIRQFPSLFFFDVSAFKDKWIMLDSEDSDSSLGGFIDFDDLTDAATGILPEKEKTDGLKAELPHIARLAFSKKVIVATFNGKEILDKHPTHKIKIIVDPEKLPEFVEAYRKSAEERGVDLTKSGNLGDIDKILTNLIKPDFIKQAKDFFENTTFNVWVDQAGYAPRKMTISVIVIPPDKIEKLKDRQFTISFGITLDHLNEEPNVKTPSDVITGDELERLMTGKTVEEQQFDRQRNAISDIRSALSNYNRINKKHPDTLGQLLNSKPTNTNSISKTDDNYFYGTKKNIPVSIYDKKPFQYTNEGENYKLVYTMKIPPEKENNDDYYGSSSSYYTSQYVDGLNTATKDFVSLEAEKDKDSDGDGLTDIEETKYGTNKYRADTDGDGFTDKEEIDSGNDPLSRNDPLSNTSTQTVIPEAYLNTMNHNYPESYGMIEIPITLTTTSSVDVSVQYKVVGGYATNGVDYSLAENGTVIIPADSKEALLRFEIIEDTDIETAESIIIELVDADNAQVIRSNKQYQKNIIIQDNDGPEPYCTDSDGGNNYTELGEVKYYVYGHNTEWSFTDTCREEKDGINTDSGSFILEFNCYGSQGSNQPNTSKSSSIVECPGGCLNGVCAGKN